MARQRPTQASYTGFSGQMAVMAELLARCCNTAVPVVDVGTDVFAFLDEQEAVTRIQVKTGRGQRYKGEDGYRAPFDIPLKQLTQPDTPRLFYALAVRLGDVWGDFLIIPRRQLARYWNSGRKFGTENKASGNLVLTVQFRPLAVSCGEVNLTEFRNAWGSLPPIQALPAFTT